MPIRLFVALSIVLSAVAGCSGAGMSPQPGDQHRIAQIDVSQSPLPTVWAQFAVPSASASPFGIVLGPDKAVWFTETASGKIGRITPAGAFSEFALPSGTAPVTIAKSKSGRLWFTATGSAGQGIVGSISTAGVVKLYDTPTAASGPFGIASGSDGNMWFTEGAASAVGRITPTGAITEFPTLMASASPQGIAAGSDGALWFAEPGVRSIGRITTSGSLTDFQGPAQPEIVTPAKDGNVWFGDVANHAVGYITPAGIVTEYPVSSTAQVYGITGSGGNVWYVDQSAVALQYVATKKAAFSGDFTIPGQSPSPQLLTFGPDGNVWFTEPGLDAIGVYDLHPITATPSSVSFTAAGQQQSFSLSESGYGGQFTASGCSSAIVDVSPSAPATSFTLTSVAAGTCTLVVSDSQLNSTQLAITVTTTNFGVQ